MPREASLFDETDGSALEAYLLLRQDGGNIPPAWIDRARHLGKTAKRPLRRLCAKTPWMPCRSCVIGNLRIVKSAFITVFAL